MELGGSTWNCKIVVLQSFYAGPQALIKRNSVLCCLLNC